MEQTNFSFVVRLPWFKPAVEEVLEDESERPVIVLWRAQAKCFHILIFQVKAGGNSSSSSTFQTKHKLRPILFLFFGGRKEERNL